MTIDTPSSPRTRLAEAVLVAAAYTGLVWLSLAVVSWSNGVAAVWPCNSVLVAYLLTRSRRDWMLPCLFVALAAIAVTLTTARSPLLAGAFAVANVGESIIVAFLTRRAARGRPDLEILGHLTAFVGAALVAVALSATVAASALLSVGQQFGQSWLSWFAADLLGLLIVVPLLLIGFSITRASDRQYGKQLLSLLLVLATSIVVFSQSSLPLLFLMGPAVLLATFYMRGLGAVLSTLIVVVVGATGTVGGTGPIALMHAGTEAKVTLLQVFFVVTFLMSLPVAAVLAERDRVSRRLRDQEAEFRAVVDAVTDVIFRTDVAGRWTFLNPAWETLTGNPIEDSLGKSFLSLVVDEDRAAFLKRLEGLSAGLFDMVRYQFRFRTAGGEERWAEARSHRLEGPDGVLVGSAGILTDITDRVALASHLEDARRRAEEDAAAALLLASTDELTGVASRRAFLALLDQKLERGAPLAVALFDIDHFKTVNDRFGHSVGDDVLRRISAIAQNCVRDGDMVGRIGGEEFAVIMPGSTIESAAAVGERLRIACAEAVHPRAQTVTVSVGVAASGRGSDAAAILREADAALYRAKNEGRNCLRLAA